MKRPWGKRVRCWAALSILASVAPAEAATTEFGVGFGPRNGQGMPGSFDGYPLASSGTAFYVSKAGHLLTANHVAGHCQRRAILRRDGVFPAEAVAVDPAADVVILKSQPNPLAGELVLKQVPKADTDYLIVRYPHLGGIRTRTTVIASGIGVLDLVPGQFVVHATEPLVGGNSGSPIVRLDGGVAGFAQAVISDRRNYVIGVAVQLALPALKKAGVPYTEHQGKLSAARAGIIAINYTFPVLCYYREPEKKG